MRNTDKIETIADFWMMEFAARKPYRDASTFRAPTPAEQGTFRFTLARQLAAELTQIADPFSNRIGVGNRFSVGVDLAPDTAIEVALWKVKIDWRSSSAALPRETWTLFGDDLQPVVFTRQPGEIKTSVLPVIKSAP